MSNIVAVVSIHESSDKLPNSLDDVAEKAKSYDMARKLVSTLSASKGGRIIGMIEGNEIVELPISAAEVLKEIHQRLKEEIGLDCEIGVGEDSREAFEALRYAKRHSEGSIKVYRPEFEAEESSESHEISDGLSNDIKESIHKSEDYQPLEEEDKKKIAQILMIIQDNKQMFDQMKQQAPEVYGGIVSLVQSISAILQYDKVARDQHLAEMIGKINEQVQKEKQKTMKGHGKEIDRNIKKQSKVQEKKKSEDSDAISRLFMKKQALARNNATQFAEDNGHDDPQFLVRLLSAFRK